MFNISTKLIVIISLLVGISCKKEEAGEVVVRPARATWNTGYFQEALLRKGIEALGYKVQQPKDLQNPIFYKTLTLGDVDYWANGWFPNHNDQVPKDFYEKANTIGHIVKGGGLQGYLVSKSVAEKLNIKSLEDFKREEVKKAFDTNGDGKADLTACPPGWGCEKTISQHMKIFDLEKHIHASKASYEAGMAAALGRHSEGKPIFFYTWAPNWTIYKLQPGRDVVWINIPEKSKAKLSQSKLEGLSFDETADVQGAVTNPIRLGFVVSDIRIAANNNFLNKNPKIKKFMELFKLPLIDISEQNTKMNEGEKSPEDILRHANEWIKNNSSTWNSWLEAAKSAK